MRFNRPYLCIHCFMQGRFQPMLGTCPSCGGRNGLLRSRAGKPVRTTGTITHILPQGAAGPVSIRETVQ